MPLTAGVQKETFGSIGYTLVDRQIDELSLFLDPRLINGVPAVHCFQQVSRLVEKTHLRIA